MEKIIFCIMVIISSSTLSATKGYSQKLIWLDTAIDNSGLNLPYPTSIVVGQDNNIYEIGTYGDSVQFTTSPKSKIRGNNGSFIASYNDNGGFRWSIDFNGVVLYSINTDYHNNLYVTGTYNAPYDSGYFVAKCDTGGHIIWKKNLPVVNNGSLMFYPNGITVTKDGKIHLLATFNGDSALLDDLVLKSKGHLAYSDYVVCLDSSGKVLNASVFESYNNNVFPFETPLLVNNKGAVIFGISYWHSSTNEDTLILGNESPFKGDATSLFQKGIKISLNGTVQTRNWQQYIYFGEYYFFDTSTNYFYCLGGSPVSISIVRVDTTGNWDTTGVKSWNLPLLTGTQYIYDQTTCTVNNKGDIFVGTTWNNTHYLVIKLDSAGSVQWEDTAASIDTFFCNLTTDTSGNLIGTTNITYDSSMKFMGDYITYPYPLVTFKVGTGQNEDTELGIKQENITDSGKISIFPNPFTGVLNVNFSNIEDIEHDGILNVINSLGQPVYTMPVEILPQCIGNFDIDLSKLSKGFYYIVVEDNKSIMYKNGFIKQ